MVEAFGIRPKKFWKLSWHEVSIYMAAIRIRNKNEGMSDEMEWARTRALWVPLKNAFFKKEGGGEYGPFDLIKLSFDKTEEEKQPKPKSFKEVKELLGGKIKKDGK